MEINLSPDQEAHLAALAASAGRSPDEIVQEAVALWEEHQMQRLNPQARPMAAEAAARIRALRKGKFLPEGVTIRDLIDYGRA